MAKDSKINIEVEGLPQGLGPQGSDNHKKKGILFGVLALITALAVIVGVVGGAFFILISNNINGIADTYKKEIQGIPVLSMALPKEADPEDPKNMTEEQIKAKYLEYKSKSAELTKKLDEANKKIDELQKIKDEQDKIKAESEKIKKDAEAQKAQIDQQAKQMEEDKKKVDELIAKGDKAGFKSYYEKLDKENAKKLYAEILEEQKADEDALKFAKLYENMDPSSAASIFEQLGTGKIDLTVNILKFMKKESTAEVMAAMTPAFAAKVTEKLSKYYMATPTP